MLNTTGVNMTDLKVNLNETKPQEDPMILVKSFLTYKIVKSNL